MRGRRAGRALPAIDAGRAALARHHPHRPLRLDVEHEVRRDRRNRASRSASAFRSPTAWFRPTRRSKSKPRRPPAISRATRRRAPTISRRSSAASSKSSDHCSGRRYDVDTERSGAGAALGRSGARTRATRCSTAGLAGNALPNFRVDARKSRADGRFRGRGDPRQLSRPEGAAACALAAFRIRRPRSLGGHRPPNDLARSRPRARAPNSISRSSRCCSTPAPGPTGSYRDRGDRHSASAARKAWRSRACACSRRAVFVRSRAIRCAPTPASLPRSPPRISRDGFRSCATQSADRARRPRRAAGASRPHDCWTTRTCLRATIARAPAGCSIISRRSRRTSVPAPASCAKCWCSSARSGRIG